MATRNPGENAERFKTFLDAAVAIAMTLLILPLMEGVGEAAEEHLTGAEWLTENLKPLFGFLLSFVIIANFWIGHHRVFAHVERVTGAIMLLTFAWLLMIVWMPVSTALVWETRTDTVQTLLYVGPFVVTSLLMAATNWYLLRHPELHEYTNRALVRAVLVDVAQAILFTLALVVIVWVPAVGYYAMFLLLLTGTLVRVLVWIARRAGADVSDPRETRTR